jgi:hypothetical protein
MLPQSLAAYDGDEVMSMSCPPSPLRPHMPLSILDYHFDIDLLGRLAREGGSR